jgi:DeoR/GlpR family transcriptional regulator of sugar metabolism
MQAAAFRRAVVDTKFGRTFAGLIAPLQAAQVIITDDRVSADVAQQFEAAGHQIMQAACES